MSKASSTRLIPNWLHTESWFRVSTTIGRDDRNSCISARNRQSLFDKRHATMEAKAFDAKRRPSQAFSFSKAYMKWHNIQQNVARIQLLTLKACSYTCVLGLICTVSALRRYLSIPCQQGQNNKMDNNHPDQIFIQPFYFFILAGDTIYGVQCSLPVSMPIVFCAAAVLICSSMILGVTEMMWSPFQYLIKPRDSRVLTMSSVRMAVSSAISLIDR